MQSELENSKFKKISLKFEVCNEFLACSILNEPETELTPNLDLFFEDSVWFEMLESQDADSFCEKFLALLKPNLKRCAKLLYLQQKGML